MTNDPNGAKAEGLPLFTRRSILGHGAVALAGGASIAFAVPDMDARATVAHAENIELSGLIEAHRAALAAFHAYSDTVADAEEAFFNNKSNEDACLAKDKAHDIQSGLLDVEKAAFLALLSYPVSTLDELRTIVTIGQKTWWDDDSPDSDEAEALIAGILGHWPEASTRTG